MIPAMIPAMIPHLNLSDRRHCPTKSGARKDKRDEENDWRRAKYNKTAEYYIKKAEAGDNDAQFRLGRGYEHGEDDELDLEMDKAKALEYYRKAAMGGHADAVDRLVDAYDAGELGVMALEYYQKSAKSRG